MSNGNRRVCFSIEGTLGEDRWSVLCLLVQTLDFSTSTSREKKLFVENEEHFIEYKFYENENWIWFWPTQIKATRDVE